MYLILREDFLSVVPKFLRRTLMKFGCNWRKISRKGKCRKDSESTLNMEGGILDEVWTLQRKNAMLTVSKISNII